MSSEKSLQDRLVEKAVDLWTERLKAPVFDNGDNSDVGVIGQALHRSNVHSAASKVPLISDAIENSEQACSSR